MSVPRLRLLLDEHYPERLASLLRAEGVDAQALVADRPDLVGQDDAAVLAAAVADGRAVVTEDVTTFLLAARAVPEHRGVILCSARRFPRSRAALPRLVAALVALAAEPPVSVGTAPVVWWLAPASPREPPSC